MLVLDLVERQDDLVRMAILAAKLTAIIRQDRLHRQVQVLVEWQDIVVEQRHSRFWLLGSMQEAEGITAVGVHRGVQVNLADALEMPYIKSIL